MRHGSTGGPNTVRGQRDKNNYGGVGGLAEATGGLRWYSSR